MNDIKVDDVTKNLIEFQDRLERLNNDNIKETAEWIINSEFFTKERLSSTIDFILILTINNIINYDNSSKLFEYLIKENKEVSILSFYSAMNRNEYKLCRFLIEKDDVFLKIFIKAADDLKKEDALYWVAPELSNIPDIGSREEGFISVKKEIYSKNNWEVYKLYLVTGFIKETLGYYIYNDDLDNVAMLYQKNPKDFELPIDYLYSYKTPIKSKTNAINLAAYFGAVKCFDFLYEKQNNISENTVYMATAGKDQVIFNKIKDKINDIDCTMKFAIRYHNYNVIDYLIKERNAPNPSLHYSIDSFNFRTLLYSVQNNLDVKIVDSSDISPIRLSVQAGFIEITKYLKNSGAELDISCFSIAVTNDSRSYYIPYFVKECSFDPNMEVESKPIILDSFGSDSMECARQLLLNGANANVLLKNGTSLLAMAAQNNSFDAVKLLLEFKADINQKLNMGLLAIHYAMTPEMLELLKQNGADLNSQEDNGGTPLHFALWENRIEAVRYLVNNNVKTDIPAGPKRITAVEIVKKANVKTYNEIFKNILKD